MKQERFTIGAIPCTLFGQTSDNLFLYVHGKHANKEEAARLAEHAIMKGYQVLSFDLPEHGERTQDATPCHPQVVVQELATIYGAAEQDWRGISLFACSLGAYFSLLAYKDIVFRQVLLQSPVVDMQRLIHKLMAWSGISEDRLQQEQEIGTSFGETLSWEYYTYVKEHPVRKWPSRTSIILGGNDLLIDKATVDAFAQRFDCQLHLLEDGEHHFKTSRELQLLDRWMHRTMI